MENYWMEPVDIKLKVKRPRTTKKNEVDDREALVLASKSKGYRLQAIEWVPLYNS